MSDDGIAGVLENTYFEQARIEFMPLDRHTHTWSKPDNWYACEWPQPPYKGAATICGAKAEHETKDGWMCDTHFLIYKSKTLSKEMVNAQ